MSDYVYDYSPLSTRFSLKLTDADKNIEKSTMVDVKRHCSVGLSLCFAIQFFCLTLLIKLVADETFDGTMIRRFQVASLMFIVFFQILTSIITFMATIYFFEKAWKGSYGYGDDRLTKIMCLCMFLLSAAMAGLGVYLLMKKEPDEFKYHGIFFWILATTSLLYCWVLFRRFRITNNFVSDTMHANGINCIPLTEQNARDLFEVQDCERELHTYINSTSFLGYQRHMRCVRHAEYYALQKWIAQLERIQNMEDNQFALSALIKEMVERCAIFKIADDTQQRYRQLAHMPLIFIPVDQCSCVNEDDNP